MHDNRHFALLRLYTVRALQEYVYSTVYCILTKVLVGILSSDACIQSGHYRSVCTALYSDHSACRHFVLLRLYAVRALHECVYNTVY